MLKPLFESANVLAAIRKHERTIAVHLIFNELTKVNTSSVLFFLLDVFLFLLLTRLRSILEKFAVLSLEGKLTLSMLASFLKLSRILITVLIHHFTAPMEHTVLVLSTVNIAILKIHDATLHSTFIK